MRGIRYAPLCLSLVGSVWAAQGRTGAASMDPYLPIRNTALQFELGANYANQPSYFAPKDSAARLNSETSGSDKVNFRQAGTQTDLRLKIRHGFVGGADAILEIPFHLASGGSRRLEPNSKNSDDYKGLVKADTISSGFGDWTIGVKSTYEPWGVGAYFAVILPVGEIFGSNAYTNGDGQLNFGVLYGATYAEMVQVMTNFVYGFDLPATNRKLDKQDSYSFYFRLGGAFPKGEALWRPYAAYKLEGFQKYYLDKKPTASAAMRHLVIPGIDANLFGDFSAEVGFPIVLAGKGNSEWATTSGWGIDASLKYFWYRF